MAPTPEQPNQVYFWDGMLVFAAQSLRNDKHRHYPASLHIAVEAPFTLDVDGVGAYAYQIALIAPNAASAVDTWGQPLIDILIDPESDVFGYLRPLLGVQPVRALEPELLKGFRPNLRAMLAGTLNCDEALCRVHEILEALCDYQPRPLVFEPRIRQTLERLDRHLDDPPSITELAAEAELSESRFMALFKQQLGLPVRQYLLWKRLRRAAVLWAEGRPLTDVAVEAGFYDQAHFTRTVRRMLDIAPSLLTDPASTEVHKCV